jgi:hypothetical protein
MALTPPEPDADLFEGVTLLRTLIERIIRPQAEPQPGPRSNGKPAKNTANGEHMHERSIGDSRPVQAGRA